MLAQIYCMYSLHGPSSSHLAFLTIFAILVVVDVHVAVWYWAQCNSCAVGSYSNRIVLKLVSEDADS